MTSIVSRLSASDPVPFARNGRALDTREPADLDMPRADARGLVLIGCLTLLLLFGGFGLWSVMVPLRSAVVAQGVVKVISKRKAVQHLDGGGEAAGGRHATPNSAARIMTSPANEISQTKDRKYGTPKA